MMQNLSNYSTTTIDPVTAFCTPLKVRLDIYIAGWIVAAEGILTIILNAVLITLLLMSKKKTNLSFLILNLAFADLSVALLHDFPRMIQHHYSWTYGIGICLLFEYTQEISLFASTYLLVSLSLDRLVAIYKPLSQNRKKKMYRYSMVLLPWFVAAIFSLPYLRSVIDIECGDLDNITKFWCVVDFTGLYGRVFSPLTSAFLILIPAFLLMSIYGYIFHVIKNRLRNGQTIDGSSCALRSNQIQALSSAKKRSLVITFVIGIVFIICWLPSTLATYITMASADVDLGSTFYIMEALCPLNSCVNPIIIFVFNYKMFKPKLRHTHSSFRQTLSTSLKDNVTSKL